MFVHLFKRVLDVNSFAEHARRYHTDRKTFFL